MDAVLLLTIRFVEQNEEYSVQKVRLFLYEKSAKRDSFKHGIFYCFPTAWAVHILKLSSVMAKVARFLSLADNTLNNSCLYFLVTIMARQRI